MTSKLPFEITWPLPLIKIVQKTHKANCNTYGSILIFWPQNFLAQSEKTALNLENVRQTSDLFVFAIFPLALPTDCSTRISTRKNAKKIKLRSPCSSKHSTEEVGKHLSGKIYLGSLNLPKSNLEVFIADFNIRRSDETDMTWRRILLKS